MAVSSAKIREVRYFESRLINVDNAIERLIQSMTKAGSKSHPEFEELFNAERGKLKILKKIKTHWKTAIDNAIKADLKGDINGVITYKAAAKRWEMVYDNQLFHLAIEVLNRLGRVPDRAKLLKLYNEEREKQRKIEFEADKAILGM